MSWDQIAAGIVSSAGQTVIAGLDGAVWANTGVQVTPQEILNFANAFKNPSSLYSTGAFIGGEKYMVLSVSDSVIQLKKGKGGAVIAKTNMGLVLSVAGEDSNISQNQASNAVVGLADKLKEKGC